MIARFFKWWFSELTALVPGAQRQRVRAQGQRLIVALSDSTVEVKAAGTRGAQRELTARRDDHARVQDAVAQVAATLDPSRTRCEVQLPAQMALVREVSLPLAAEENLREVLGFEMDRQTPFRAGDVYFDYQVLERDRVAQQLNVRLMVARRALVEPLISGLSLWDLEPAPGAAHGDDSDVVWLQFLPASFRTAKPFGVNALLAAVVIALAGYLLYLPIASQSEQRDALQMELDKVRREAAETVRLRETLDARGASVAMLTEARASRPAMVEILEALSQLLPDHTFLSRLEVRRSEVTLQGSSQAASALIALLESDPRLSNVRFASPVTRDARSGGERFHITASVRSPSETTAQAER